jgi:hypothetical protein
VILHFKEELKFTLNKHLLDEQNCLNRMNQKILLFINYMSLEHLTPHQNYTAHPINFLGSKFLDLACLP